MTLAFDQASSLVTGWVRSCWECLSGMESQGQLGQRTEGRGVEREMQVCHNQPHLVPPMKLVVYDDLPSPGIRHQSRNSLSSWLGEGRQLASRASGRASISWKRQTTAPLKISAPSDFRRVQSFQLEPSPIKFQPLQLSIHRSGHRLSDLPSFETFEVDENSQRMTLAIPPRVLSPARIRSRRCQSSEARFSVSRKPVGSANRRSANRRSLANMEVPIEPPRPVRVASALIPHFCTVIPVEPPLPEEPIPTPTFIPTIPAIPVVPTLPTHVRSRSEESNITLDTELSIHVSNGVSGDDTARTPTTSKHGDEPTDEPSFKDSPSTASSRTMPSRISSLRRPSIAENRKTIASVPLPSRVTQWIFPTKPSGPQQVSLAGENGFDWERTRTLSSTTVNSTITTITGGAMARRPNASISSTFTNGTTPRTSLQGPSSNAEKDLEAGFGHPNTFETRRQHYPYPSPLSNNVPQYRGSAIGVAF
ncbi:uncharacterized protein N7496_002900 [Penicillium cataractarum]|uniref:Uncharacterized protein n=1 Tax=Penicillium cataractarum TaxID=2100454 RepID=A0A9W9VFW8_9EURO|nr:uncharacterized protein N7496_002900 [Penicillium cataractarum]KAJ5380472.1 hypothetical protein N7496_002900 [Penicillium cataractarum]